MSFEKELVRLIGERIGYGRTMQLCEELWDEKMPGAGAAHATYCCTGSLVPCPGCAPARARNEHCDWCCGAGRVTKKVAEAVAKEGG